MKAAICTRYGPPEVILIKDVPTPFPKKNELCIRVLAASVSSADNRIRKFDMPRGMSLLGRLGLGFLKPRQPILGNDLAGVVEQIGKAVTRFEVGDSVIASLGNHTGAHAEFIILPEDGLIVSRPKEINMAESASILFGGLTALHFLQSKAQLQRGERLLINGASGAVGCSSIQLAKAIGAHVTAVCSARNTKFVQSLGADKVIAYDRDDSSFEGNAYDVIMDNVGNLPWKKSRKLLKARGRLLGVVR